jgi:hypothetical protein
LDDLKTTTATHHQHVLGEGQHVTQKSHRVMSADIFSQREQVAGDIEDSGRV